MLVPAMTVAHTTNISPNSLTRVYFNVYLSTLYAGCRPSPAAAIGRAFSSMKTSLIRLLTTFEPIGILCLDQTTTPDVVIISKQSNILAPKCIALPKESALVNTAGGGQFVEKTQMMSPALFRVHWISNCSQLQQISKSFPKSTVDQATFRPEGRSFESFPTRHTASQFNFLIWRQES